MRHGARALEGVAGFVEAPRFYPYLSARKNLELLAALDGDGARGRIGEVLETVELTPRAGHKVGGYSHGMRQRLGHRGGAAAGAPAADPRRARHRARPGRHARHARADQAPRRRRHDGAAVLPPAARGPGTVRPRGDRRLAAASSTRARCRTCAARAAPATGCAPPTTSGRWRCCAPSRASASAAAGAGGTRVPGPGARRRRALARARAGRHRDPRADAPAGDARGPLLPPHRGRSRRRRRRAHPGPSTATACRPAALADSGATGSAGEAS